MHRSVCRFLVPGSFYGVVLVALLPPVLLAAGCATTAPEDRREAPAESPETPPPAPVEPAVDSFAELEEKYAGGLGALHGLVESSEEQKRSIVERARSEIAADRQEVERLEEEIRSLERQITGAAERLEETQKALQRVRREAGEEAGSHLAQEAAELQNRIEELADVRRERRARKVELEASVERRAGLSDEELFGREVQSIYRETLELQQKYYRDGISLARARLAGEEAGFLVEHFRERLRQRDRALEEGSISREVVRTFRRQAEGDRRMEEALYQAYVLEVRFPTGRHEMERISAEERENLELLVEGLIQGWEEWDALRIFVDGHSDTQRFRNVSACVSATRNLELSRQRATAVRDFLAERLGEGPRYAVDWFGNFALQAEPGPDQQDNRRIELRIASEGQETTGAHAEYFDLRRDVEMSGRTFVREPGRWIEEACVGEAAAERVEHLSHEYDALVQRLGLDPDAYTRVDLGEGRELLLRPGNAAVVRDGAAGACVEIVPCTGP